MRVSVRGLWPYIFFYFLHPRDRTSFRTYNVRTSDRSQVKARRAVLNCVVAASWLRTRPACRCRHESDSGRLRSVRSAIVRLCGTESVALCRASDERSVAGESASRGSQLRRSSELASYTTRMPLQARKRLIFVVLQDSSFTTPHCTLNASYFNVPTGAQSNSIGS